MRRIIPIATAAFLLGTVNVTLANDGSGGSMDLENPQSRIPDTQADGGQKHDQLTGDARDSTTGKRLIKSDAQKHDAEQGGLDGVK
jgi:hypothetical protein